MQRLKMWILLIVLVSGAMPKLAFAQTSQENELKAVFLLNFVRYVEWPGSAFATSNSPVVIGILGTDPFRGALDQVVQGEKAGERKIVVRYFDRIEESRGCHLLYINTTSKARIREATSYLNGLPILTASDMEGFLDLGGMIALTTTANQKLKIIIQIDKVKTAKLNVSSKLLGLAEIRRSPRRMPPGGALNLLPDIETTCINTDEYLLSTRLQRQAKVWI